MKSYILFVLQVLIVLQCLITTSFGDIGITRPEVKVTNGFVWGTVVKAANGKDVYAFTGIPFAKPPVGELRFKRPVPLTERWSVPFDASKLPNACPQINIESFPNFTGERVWNPNTKVSEDCLYLNVWVPASMFKKQTNILFWIYGGGFYSGSSSLEIYNGATLAAEQDAIVVSTQYRLGAQGFLYFGTEDAPGNMGLMDQNLALKWVNDNIQAFGGNPAEVTLFGESAGAASVSYQLLSPLSQNLFKRVVLMSGVATAPWAFSTPDEAMENSYKFAKDAGCPTEALGKNAAQVLECLKQVDSDTLIKALWMQPRQILELPMTPTIDGLFLLDSPSELIKNWDTKRAEVMIGNTADEGTYFLPYKYRKYFHYLKSTSISYDGYLSIMREIFQDWPTAEKDAILFHYTNWVNREDGLVNAKNIADAIGDAFFVCPLRDFADQWSGRGLNVYYYFFTEHTDSDPWGRWMGVKHGDEIVYFFGKPVNASTQEYTAKESQLSHKVITLLSTFAKTGRASRKWERYTRDYPIYLDLNGTVISDETQESVHGPRAEACAFWNIYLPQLRKTLELENGNIIERNGDGGSCNRMTEANRGRRNSGEQTPENKRNNQVDSDDCCGCCSK